MKIVTFNIRCPWKDRDGINDFIHRAGLIYDKVEAEKPEVIAFQEIRKPTLELLQKMFPDYSFFGTLREKDYTGEGVYTAIRKDACSVLATEVFWLSPTPFAAGSRFADQSKCPRVCLMTKIRHHATNQVFRLMNLHLDHVSDAARRQGIACVFSFLGDYEKRETLPTMLMGDFNADPESGVMQYCFAREDLVDATAAIPVTFHGYGSAQSKIDYILLSRSWEARVQSVTPWTDVHEGIYLSDHYPVCMEISME